MEGVCVGLLVFDSSSCGMQVRYKIPALQHVQVVYVCSLSSRN